MKVGIFTFHYASNYGAVLQCLALYRTLRRMGHEIDVIRYVPEGFAEYPSFWRGWGIKKGQALNNIPKKWITARHGPAMKRAFDAFREEYFTFSAACTSPEEIATAVSDYDVLITGSDQVWHFAQAAPFFLEWGIPYNGKRISYAPCCGHKEQPSGRDGQIKEWLARFNAISVRNDFSKGIIEQLTGSSVNVVADPTLLIDLSDVQQKVELPCSEYILTYTLGKEIPGGHAKAIEAIREKVGHLPVVTVVPSAHMPHTAPWADVIVWEAGPREWLWLIANAAFVYTDSFHGALFALQYRRPFSVYYAEEGRSPRMLDLAQRYQLEGIVAKDVNSLRQGLIEDVFTDHQESLRLIEQHAKESLSFLEAALQ